MSITREQWLAAREDYIRGRGSLSAVAARHGLKKATVEKCCRREGWTQLRSDFEERALEKLLPPAPPSLPPAPVAPDGTVSESWLKDRQERYYRENAALVDKLRGLLAAKLNEEGGGSAESLAKLTSALGSIVETEIKLLGLKERNRGKGRRPETRQRYSDPEPEPESPGNDPSPA